MKYVLKSWQIAIAGALMMLAASQIPAISSPSTFYPVKDAVIASSGMISNIKTTEQELIERIDTADPYRWPKVGLVSDPFNLKGKLHALFYVIHFQNYAMVPSKLYGTDDINATGNISAYYANFPPCLSEIQNNCIYEFSVKKENGENLYGQPYARIPQVKQVSTTFDAYRWDDPKYTYGNFKRNESLNMPDGGDLWMWGITDTGITNLYSASVVMNGYLDRTSKTKRFMNPSTSIQIVPIKVDAPTQKCSNENSCSWRDINVGMDGSIFDSEEFSLRRVPFVTKGEFTLRFRTSVAWTTWMVSTISKISVEGKKENEIYYYGVSGEVSRIPSIKKQIELTNSNKEILQKMDFMAPCASVAQYCVPIARIGFSNVDATQVGYVGAAEIFTDGKASFSSDSWALRSANFARVPGGKLPSPELTKCVSNDKLEMPAGVTGSNATIFEHNPPTWDPIESTFTYRVASFSKDENGKEFLGNYSLLVNKEVSKCLWRDTTITPKARIEILNSDGSNQVATVSMGSNSTWDTFQATGFHFSSPKLVITLPKESLAQNKPTKKDKVRGKFTIKCVKGKISKSVTGNNPKCPKGFKLIK